MPKILTVSCYRAIKIKCQLLSSYPHSDPRSVSFETRLIDERAFFPETSAHFRQVCEFWGILGVSWTASPLIALFYQIEA